MDAYEVMREWDRVIGLEPRSNEELDKTIPGTIASLDYEDWKARLEARDVDAIIEGMKCWGIPIGPLAPFALDDHIETAERPD
jgi:hypothetical protein